MKPGAKALFSGKAPSAMTPAELEQIAALTHDSSATVAVVIALLLLLALPAAGIIAAIAIPGLLRARQSGNEAAAIGALRAITSAQATFAVACGNGFYAQSLSALAQAPAGGVPFVSPDLGQDPAMKSGYVITLTAGDTAADAPRACNDTPVARTFFATAAPMSTGTTGNRYFGVNSAGTIFQSTQEIPVTQIGTPVGALPLD